MEIFVENIKCGGCVSTLKKKLTDLKVVEDVVVDIDTGKITLSGNPNREEVVKKLDTLGYPEVGKNTFLKKSKSMVSCAVGKLTE